MICDSFHSADLSQDFLLRNRISSVRPCYAVEMDDDLDTAGKRLRFARERAGFRTAKNAAKKAGIGEVSWRAYENDQHGYSRKAPAIAKLLGVSIEWLLDGGAPLEPDDPAMPEASADETLRATDIELIRRVDISYAMGDGSVIEDYPETDFLPFSLNFLRQFARGTTDRLFIATGHGESMEPTLRRDDLVMIDTSQDRVAFQDHLWALTYCGAGMIKRLRRISGDRMLILSDNPSVPPQEADEEDVHIVGKVVWIARMM